MDDEGLWEARTAAVIPAFNEGQHITATVKALQSVEALELVLVVDDGSLDDTARRAEDAGAAVISLPVNRGKGGALNAAMDRVRADIYLFLDADLGPSAVQARRLLQVVTGGQADLAVASFPADGSGGGFGLTVGLARWGVWRFTRCRLRAPLSGQRAFTHRVWKAVRPLRPGFGAELGMTLHALRAGFRLKEVPTTMTHRVTGWSPRDCLHRARQGFAVARTLLTCLPEVLYPQRKDISSHT